MLGIIVIGHGRFSEGIISALELIVGKQEKLYPILYEADSNPEILANQLEDIISKIHNDGIIIFTDLKGGYPYQAAVTIASKFSNIEILSGTNIAMLLEACILRQSDNSLDIVYKLIETGKSQVDRFEFEIIERDIINELEEGI